MDFPQEIVWQDLSQKVDGRLSKCTSPLKELPMPARKQTFDNLVYQMENPFLLQELPWASQSTGWHDAWEMTVSPYVLEAEKVSDIVEAIKNKTETAYITKRWQKVAKLLATMPNDLYNALSARPGGSF